MDFWLTVDRTPAYPHSILSCLIISRVSNAIWVSTSVSYRLEFRCYKRHTSSWTASAFPDRLLCCQTSLQPLCLKECVSSEHKWVGNWKHRLLHLVNFPYMQCPHVLYASKAEEGLTSISRVSMHFPFLYSFKWMSLQLWIDGSLWDTTFLYSSHSELLTNMHIEMSNEV